MSQSDFEEWVEPAPPRLRADVRRAEADPERLARPWRRPLDTALRDDYLKRLGWDAPPPPTLDTLVALHHAHVERVPFEVVWIAIGEPRGVEPLESVRHVVGGRGGYCYHLNGAFACLLDWLGFDAHWRVGTVQLSADSEPFRAYANHLAVEVRGLPSAQSPGGRWYVDIGLGDALHGPLPLVPGQYRQGPSVFGLRPSGIVPGGWRFDHDPRGYFHGMDFTPFEGTLADFGFRQKALSTEPESGFVRIVSVCRRDADTVTTLRGLVLTHRTTEGEDKSDIADQGDYFATLADVFELPLSDVDTDRRAALWARLLADHEVLRRGK
ncbi:arylamine N-acetyltransferase [Actinokineospora auranticolor]|uniref:Arylamine N-acetyltransferase n=1 Tax=Actinokineospora auranticolor TaxID=155976 RepID=A0A2S6GW86_9PSEU|nr:arylamine N-acetyltransferase [Actinokineospora auranticolor]PPK69440.1 arylamine N-acetyltransferase [Actinokineospora auranticolor]